MSLFRRWCSRLAGVLALMLGMVGCENGGGGGGAGDGHDFGINNPDVLIAMGDSITRGGYPAILSSMLGKPVANLGVGGSTSDHGAAGINGALAKYKPGFVLILYGANDISFGHPASRVIDNLRYMVQSAKGRQTVPVLATLTPEFGEHAIFEPSVKALNEQIRSLASSEGVALADLESAFGDSSELFQADGLHPTAAGQQLIAQTFFDVLN